MKVTGKIIPLAFPDTFVKHSDEKRVRLLKFAGLGTKTHIKAGHAALVLVENATGQLHYFDFGRYVTPSGKGRVRSKKTDVELEIPFTAQFTSKNDISNIKDILSWLQTHPQCTHGAGRMVASVGDIDFEAAFHHLSQIQDQPSVPYKAFGAGQKEFGTNCSRLVTDTIFTGVADPKIRKKLQFIKRFTPSPIGNVEILANGSQIYAVSDGVVMPYDTSAFKENLVNFFDKRVPSVEVKEVVQPENTQLLSGIGSSAFFRIEASAEANTYCITRFNDLAEEDFKGLFNAEDSAFDITKAYHFTYNSHCYSCRIEQNGKIIQFNLKE